MKLTVTLPGSLRLTVTHEGDRVVVASPARVRTVAVDIGGRGLRGPAGPSAYDTAVEEGFSGTEAEWLASLQGTDGDDGVGVPAGGTTGQVLTKTSGADYATAWVAPQLVIGTVEPVLATGEQALWLDTTGGNVSLFLVTGD